MHDLDAASIRLEMLRAALARVDDLDIALDKARRLEAYVLHGGLSLPAPSAPAAPLPSVGLPPPGGAGRAAGRLGRGSAASLSAVAC